MDEKEKKLEKPDSKSGDEKDQAEKPEKKMSKKSKIILALVLTLVLGCASAAGIFFAHRSASYLTTDNAVVRTTLAYVSASLPGRLERFLVYEGRYVAADEVLGWVEGDRSMRSPFDGLVIYASAIQGQTVNAMQALAVIADINRIHIQANIEETDITRLRVGQAAYVTIDGLGSRRFSGYIANIGRITHAELTGQTLFFNTGGNFTRVTHLLPIEIHITDDVNLDSLIGVNARVRIPLN